MEKRRKINLVIGWILRIPRLKEIRKRLWKIREREMIKMQQQIDEMRVEIERRKQEKRRVEGDFFNLSNDFLNARKKEGATESHACDIEEEKDDFLIRLRSIEREWNETISANTKVAAKGKEVILDFSTCFDDIENLKVESNISTINPLEVDESGEQTEVKMKFSYDCLIGSIEDEDSLITELDYLLQNVENESLDCGTNIELGVEDQITTVVCLYEGIIGVKNTLQTR